MKSCKITDVSTSLIVGVTIDGDTANIGPELIHGDFLKTTWDTNNDSLVFLSMI